MKKESSAEEISTDKSKSSSRFQGTSSLARIYRRDTPGQVVSVIKKIVREKRDRDKR